MKHKSMLWTFITLFGLLLAAISSGCVTASTTPLSDDEFSTELYSSYAKIAAINVRIAQQTHDDELYDWYYELLSQVKDDKTKFQSLSVSDQMEPIKQEYIEALDSYQDYAENAQIFLTSGDMLYLNKMEIAVSNANLHMAAVIELMEERSGVFDQDQNSVVDTLQTTTITPTDTPLVDLYPDALALKAPYKYEEGHDSISVIVDYYTLRDTYTIKQSGKTTVIEPNEGNKFLFVYVKVTYLGYSGDYSSSVMATPGSSLFKLIVDGQSIYQKNEYSEVINMGTKYDVVLLDRHESIKGYIIYEVPNSFNLSNSYISFDHDAAIWKLN